MYTFETILHITTEDVLYLKRGSKFRQKFTSVHDFSNNADTVVTIIVFFSLL